MDAIRLATEQDAGPIAHVHVESWRAAYKGIVPDAHLAGLNERDGTARWREWIQSGVPIFVALQDGAVAGFVSGGPIREPLDGYDAELFTIYLLQHFQRRGIGKALMRKIASRLDRDGFTSMAAWVLEDNRFSRFYERSGARRVASKQIEIGGAVLPVVAYGWPSLQTILSPEQDDQSQAHG